MLVLTLDDVLARVPTRALKPGLHDPARRLHFAMEELLDGISRGRATIMLSKLAERYPETFEAPAPGTEDSPIFLPLQKLIQQIGRATRQHPEKPVAPVVAEPAPAAKVIELAPVPNPPTVEPDPVVSPVARLLRRLKVMQEPVENTPVAFMPTEPAKAEVPRPAEVPLEAVVAEPSPKVEAARVEAAKLEAAKVEAARVEAAKLEAAKAEAARVEAARLEAAKAEAARVEAAKLEAAKAEAARVEAAKLEAAKAEAARVEAAKLEAAKAEAARVEAAKLEAAKAEAARVEAAKLEAAKAEAARVETARLEAAKAEAARVEAAKLEAAKAEAARVEAAKLEAAKAEAARLEAAKLEAAKAEAARLEAARLEAAKAMEKLPPLTPPPLPVAPPPEARVHAPEPPPVAAPAPEVPHSPILENPPANLESNVRLPAGRPLVRPPSLQGPAGLVAPETTPTPAPAMPGFVFAPRPTGQQSDFARPAAPSEDEPAELHIPPLFAVHPGPLVDEKPPAPEPPALTHAEPPPVEAAPAPPEPKAEPAKEPVAVPMPPVDETPTPAEPALPEQPRAGEDKESGGVEHENENEDEDDAREGRISLDSGARADDLLGTHFTLARIDQEPLQAIFMTEEFLDLARVSQLSCGFPGITGCMIVAGDALAQGGERPAGLDAEALCKLTKQLSAVAVAFPEELPAVQTYTLHVGNRALSIFARPHVSLCLVHSHRGFLPGVRERLAAVADTLSRGLGGEAEEG
jgi:uncharacterized protein YjbI with pentapeptide repeats